MSLLGHKNVESSMVSAQLISFESDMLHSTVEKTIDELRKLLEEDFDYVCQETLCCSPKEN